MSKTEPPFSHATTANSLRRICRPIAALSMALSIVGCADTDDDAAEQDADDADDRAMIDVSSTDGVISPDVMGDGLVTDLGVANTVIFDLSAVTFAHGSYRIPVRATRAATFDTAVMTICHDADAIEVQGGAYGDYWDGIVLAGWGARPDDPCVDSYLVFSAPIDYVPGTTLMTILVSQPPTLENFALAGTLAYLGNGYGTGNTALTVIAP